MVAQDSESDTAATHLVAVSIVVHLEVPVLEVRVSSINKTKKKKNIKIQEKRNKREKSRILCSEHDRVITLVRIQKLAAATNKTTKKKIVSNTGLQFRRIERAIYKLHIDIDAVRILTTTKQYVTTRKSVTDITKLISFPNNNNKKKNRAERTQKSFQVVFVLKKVRYYIIQKRKKEKE